MGEQAEAIVEKGRGQSESPSTEQQATLPDGSNCFWGLTRCQFVLLAGVVLAVQLPFAVYELRGWAPVAAQLPFSDDFNRETIGKDYFATGGFWRLENGQAYSPGVKNNPLWLKAAVPPNVVIEFDARSESVDGDIKCEIFGNGRDHSSGYVIIFGGWSNTISVISRLDEHGRDRLENRSAKVEKGRTYRFRIEREEGLLRWLVDGKLMMEYDDPKPLRGRGHDRFGFSSWDSEIFFDNLKVESL